MTQPSDLLVTNIKIKFNFPTNDAALFVTSHPHPRHPTLLALAFPPPTPNISSPPAPPLPHVLSLYLLSQEIGAMDNLVQK